MAATSGPRLSVSRASVTQPSDLLEEPEAESDARSNGDESQVSGLDESGSQLGSDGRSKSRSAESRSSGKEPRRVDSAIEFETDLEIDDEKDDFDMSGSRVYLETCRELGVVPASYFIRHMTQAELSMKHHGLGPLGAKAIAIPLVSNTMVNELDLEDNWIEANGAVFIADMLKENCYISHLNLSNNNVGTVAAKALCEMLLTNTTLTNVNLSGNGFQPKDAQYFAQVILENSRVTHFNLSHNAFGEDVGDDLGHAVGENETLERLDLSWNNFRRDSGNTLLDGIQVNSRLKYVNLAWNGLGLDCAPALGNCLKNNSILTELDVTNNRITMEAALVIGRGLEANETLKILRIGRNPLGPGGALVILSSINNERSILTLLDLSEVWVEKEFDDLVADIRESREDMEVKHAGILGMLMKGARKTAMPDQGESDLDRFMRTDAMAIIKRYVEEKNLRLIDLFKMFDRNNDFKITPKEFNQGVKTAGIELTPEQIEGLMARLDSEADADGKVDYREMAIGSEETQRKIRNLKKLDSKQA